MNDYLVCSRRVSLNSSSTSVAIASSISQLSVKRNQLRVTLAESGLLSPSADHPLQARKDENFIYQDHSDRVSPACSPFLLLLTHACSQVWWEKLQEAFALARGDVPLEIISLFQFREVEIRTCTSGDIRITHSPPLQSILNLTPALETVPPPETLRSILQAELFGKGYDSGRIFRCLEVVDGIQQCHAPATGLRRLSSLPFFLAVSFSSWTPAELPFNFFQSYITFTVERVDYTWTLAGWSKNYDRHYTAVVRTSDEQWLSFNSAFDHGRPSTASTQQYTGSYNGITAFYRFSGTRESCHEFNQKIGGWSGFKGIQNAALDSFAVSQITYLHQHRALFGKLPFPVVVPDPAFFPGSEGPRRVVKQYLHTKADSPRFYEVSPFSPLWTSRKCPHNLRCRFLEKQNSETVF